MKKELVVCLQLQGWSKYEALDLDQKRDLCKKVAKELFEDELNHRGVVLNMATEILKLKKGNYSWII